MNTRHSAWLDEAYDEDDDIALEISEDLFDCIT